MPYVPISDFREKDFDRSSRPIRDFPTGKSQYALEVFPKEMDFQGIGVSAHSDYQTAVLINSGYEDLVINSIEVAGSFEIETPVPTIIRRGEKIGIKIRYVPTRMGPHTGSVYIDTGEPVQGNYISLSGSTI